MPSPGFHTRADAARPTTSQFEARNRGSAFCLVLYRYYEDSIELTLILYLSSPLFSCSQIVKWCANQRTVFHFYYRDLIGVALHSYSMPFVLVYCQQQIIEELTLESTRFDRLHHSSCHRCRSEHRSCIFHPCKYFTDPPICLQLYGELLSFFRLSLVDIFWPTVRLDLVFQFVVYAH